MAGEMTVEHGLAAHAAETPEKIALVLGERERTYGELDRRVNRLARALVARGVGAGDRFAVLLGNGFEFFETTQAAARIGAAVVPINWHFKREEIDYILGDSEAKGIVADAHHAGEVGDFAGFRLVVGHGGDHDYEAALAREAETPPPGAILRHGYNVMIYTSGTTGKPKGVVHVTMEPEIGHMSLSAFAGLWGFGADDVHLVVGPLYHTAPGGYSAMHLHVGATIVVLERFDAADALATIARRRVTTSHMVPVNFVRMLALPEEERRRHDLSSLRKVLHAAAPCPEDVKRRMLELLPPGTLWEYYGATEGPGTIISPEEWLRKPGSVGRPFPGIEIKIRDDAGKELAPGEVGLIYVSTVPGRGFRYHKAPEKTAAAYRGDSFTVGDMGYLDEDGYLFICDRKADMVISGGVNIYPREIEDVLYRHPDVVDAAVFGVPDEQWGESLHAVVEPRPAANLAATDLAEFCRATLADYKCPRSFELVTELPRDPNGKVLKRKLRDARWQGRAKQV